MVRLRERAAAAASSEKSGRCCCCCCGRAAAPESHSLSHPPPLQQRTQDALRVWDASCTCLLHALLSFCEELLEWEAGGKKHLLRSPTCVSACVFFVVACMRVKLRKDEGSKTMSSRLRNRTRPVFKIHTHCGAFAGFGKRQSSTR